jgi:hypothetical protein
MVSYLDGVVPLTAPNFFSSVALERFGSAGCCLAIQRRMRSELLLAYFIFIGSGERVIHPTPRHIKPTALRASSR